MKFVETRLRGAYAVRLEPIDDERGSFARSWCVREFADVGLSTTVVQCNVSTNRRTGTLRGLHYQLSPHAEVKIVRCTRGAIFDVIVDLRRDSPTFCQWESLELSAANGDMLYVPQGFAHGFQTLTDDAAVEYQMSEFYAPDAARGARFDDPAFAIAWPLAVTSISPRDMSYPGFVG